MKRFRFPMERLLWQRRLQEEVAEQALAGAIQEERAVRTELIRLRERARQEAATLGSGLADRMQGTEFLLHVRFSAVLRGREAALQIHQAQAETRTREHREVLRERRRAREAVAQLREKAWERYRYAAAREEQLTLDEVAGRSHIRGRIEAEE
jgi:flagellar export protein FliJ